MKTVYCIHPDPFTADALAATLNTPGLGFNATPMATTDPEHAPDGVFLSDAPYGLPPERTVILGGAPIRLKTLIAQLNQKYAALDAPREITFGACRLDTVTRDFFRGETAISLTEKEAAILVHLYQNGTATRDDLLRHVWNYAPGVDTHTIETHMYRLRQKIEINPESPAILITTKDGYALAAASSA